MLSAFVHGYRIGLMPSIQVFYAKSIPLQNTGANQVTSHDSIVGGNVWITRSIPPHTKIVYRAKMQKMEEGTSDLMVLKTKVE